VSAANQHADRFLSSPTAPDPSARLHLDALPFLDVEVTPGALVGLRPMNLFCITVYNEAAAAVESTIASLCESLVEARRAGQRRPGDSCMAIVVDGRASMDATLQNFLLSAGLVTTAGSDDDGRTRFFFARHSLQRLSSVARGDGDGDGDEEIDVVVCIKGRNRGKLHSHALFFGHLCARLQPRLCFQLDCGTTVASPAVTAMLAQFEREPKTAALASRISTQPDPNAGLLANWQFMDFETQAAVYWPAEIASGHLSVLPGQFSAIRWRALTNGMVRPPFADDRALQAACAGTAADPLGRYLRGLGTRQPLERVMFLAEDRVIGNELVVGPRRWRLGYCDAAQATTDACTTWSELLRQRRRWNNGSSACRLWLASQWLAFVRRADRNAGDKLRLSFALAWQALLVLQQCLAPAMLASSLMLVLRAVEGALERHSPALPMMLAAMLAVGLAAAAWRRSRPAWMGAVRDAAFLGAFVSLAALLAGVLPPVSLVPLLLLPAAAAWITAASRPEGRRTVLGRAVEYFVVINPVMQVCLWGYAMARLTDTSWGTKGLTRGAGARIGVGATAFVGWLAVNVAVVGMAASRPPLMLPGLNLLLEATLWMFALAVVAASWPRRRGTEPARPSRATPTTRATGTVQ